MRPWQATSPLGASRTLRGMRSRLDKAGGCASVSPEVRPVNKGHGRASPQSGSVPGHLFSRSRQGIDFAQGSRGIFRVSVALALCPIFNEHWRATLPHPLGLCRSKVLANPVLACLLKPQVLGTAKENQISIKIVGSVERRPLPNPSLLVSFQDTERFLLYFWNHREIKINGHLLSVTCNRWFGVTEPQPRMGIRRGCIWIAYSRGLSSSLLRPWEESETQRGEGISIRKGQC